MFYDFLRRKYAVFGLAGSAIVLLCSLVAALSYVGAEGERYSLLNHFISELGEVGVSPLAWLFNLGLIAGGLSFIPFSLGLGLALPGWLSRLGMLAGLGAALSLSGVGIFPMNNLASHVTVALLYFRLGLATVLLFGLAILFQPKERVVLHRWASLASLLAAACYAGFIFYASFNPTTTGTNVLDTTGFRSGRPAVWPLALIEWGVFFSTILWFAVIALARRKREELTTRSSIPGSVPDPSRQ